MAEKRRKTKDSKRMSMQRRRKKKALIILAAAAFVVVFGGSGFALKNYVEKVDADIICENIYIGRLNVSGMTKEEAVAALNKQVETDESKVAVLSAEKGSAEIFLKELGYGRVDVKKHAQEAVDYGKKGSMWKRYRQMKKLEEEPYVIDDVHSLDEEMAKAELEEKVQPLIQGAVDAAITRDDQGKFSVTAEKEGETLDAEKTIETMTGYLNEDWDHQDFELEVAVKTQQPKIVKEDLEKIQDELGSFSTDAGGGQRWTNLKTGIGMLNGTVLMPGEELSVYDATAPYDEAHGYVEGTAYENGQVVPSYGGGICQVSTTLYNAVIYAELEVTERSPHSMAVDYVQPSRDAAIAGGYMDFKFKNPYDAPVYIFGEIDASNQLRVIIYGEETRDEGRSVEFESETLSTEEYSVVYRSNTQMPFGEMEYTGSPHTGREARLWKVVYENGKEVSREIFNTSYYEKSDEIIEVGLVGGSSEAIQALETAIAAQDADAIRSAIAAGSGSGAGKDESGSDSEAGQVE